MSDSPGEAQRGIDHHCTGDQTSAAHSKDGGWRDARDGGWFSYSPNIDGITSNRLLCNYCGSDTGRDFDMLIDRTKLSGRSPRNNKPREFFDVSYNISDELTKGKSKVEVKFQAKPGWKTGRFLDCRTMK